MKQMVCLMSEQLIPTYLAVKHHRPDRVWRILTERTQKEGRDRMFCETLKTHAEFELDLPDCGHVIADPTNFESTRRLVTALVAQAPDDEWVVDVTGGNKMIAAGAILAGVIADRKLIYTDIANPGQIMDARSGMAQGSGQGLKVLEFLSLYGFSGRADAVKWGLRWQDLARRFAAEPPEKYPFRLSPQEARGADRSGLRNYEGKLDPSFSAELRQALTTTVEGPHLTRRQYRFVVGTWIEVFLFDLLKGHKEALGIKDMQPGIRINHAGVENELDIALTHGLDFIYIECKSGGQRERKAGNQIEEILGTLTRLRALRAKALIATTGENFLAKSTGLLQEEARKRMCEAGMNVLIRPDIVELATRYGETGFIVPRLNAFLTGTA